MKTLLLSAADLREIVRRTGIDRLMDELIESLESALTAFDPAVTTIPVRTGFTYREPALGLVEWMPLHEPDAVTFKMVGYHPGSPDTLGLPTILSTVSRYETRTGHLAALSDATFLTALRTGAASAVATRRLAAPGSSTLGLIGAGAQAVTQLHGIGRVLGLERVLFHDVDAKAEASFADRCAAFAAAGLRFEAASLEEIRAASDVICTSTSIDVGEGPVLADAGLRPHVHVNAVGSDFPGKIEVARSLLDRAFVCADTLQQATHEGECQQLEDLSRVRELVELVRDPALAAAHATGPTVFDSTGWALEDRVALDLAVRHARDHGLGTEVAIEALTEDPRHPYEFLTVPVSTDQA